MHIHESPILNNVTVFHIMFHEFWMEKAKLIRSQNQWNWVRNLKSVQVLISGCNDFYLFGTGFVFVLRAHRTPLWCDVWCDSHLSKCMVHLTKKRCAIRASKTSLNNFCVCFSAATQTENFKDIRQRIATERMSERTNTKCFEYGMQHIDDNS